jgi:hydrogenase maturation protease
MTARVLIAGVGNIFFSDDGFGVEVAKRLAAGPLPAGVRVADFGIRGIHLVYELLEGYDKVILVDAAPRGEPPGTVYVVEPEADAFTTAEATAAGDAPLLDAHGLEPVSVLSSLRALGGRLEGTVVVGCEPLEVGEGIGLSEPVAGAVDEAVAVVRELLDERPGEPVCSGRASHRLRDSREGG